MHYVVKGEKIALQAFDGVCYSYEPGHSVHPIQFNAASNERRLPVLLFQMSDTQIELVGANRSWSVHNHSATAIVDNLMIHRNATVEFAPRSSVVFIQADETNGFAYHVSRAPIDSCGKDPRWKSKESGSWL